MRYFTAPFNNKQTVELKTHHAYNLQSGILFSEGRESIAAQEPMLILSLLYFCTPPKKEYMPDHRLHHANCVLRHYQLCSGPLRKQV